MFGCPDNNIVPAHAFSPFRLHVIDFAIGVWIDMTS